MASPDFDDATSAWQALLDSLDEYVEMLHDLTNAVSQGNFTDVAPWMPPEDLGPLPEELAPRARQLLTSQRAALAGLGQARRSVGDQLSLLRSVPLEHSSDTAIYMDVTS